MRHRELILKKTEETNLQKVNWRNNLDFHKNNTIITLNKIEIRKQERESDLITENTKK